MVSCQPNGTMPMTTGGLLRGISQNATNVSALQGVTTSKTRDIHLPWTADLAIALVLEKIMCSYTTRFKIIAVLISLAFGVLGEAAELKPEALQAWESYLANTRSQIATRLQSEESFLRSGETQGTLRRIRTGEIVIVPEAQTPKPVPEGLIHHWIGAVFVPDSTIADVLGVVRDYPHFAYYYEPNVVESKLLAQHGDEYSFDMVIMSQSLFSKTALDGEYTDSYFRVSDTRWYSVTHSTRIQQIEDFGRPDEQRLPPDKGSGYIWRLCTVSRFEQRDGGVYVELELMVLSRDIPPGLRWLVNPIVRRVSRNALQTSLDKTRSAVSAAASASRRSNPEVLAQVHERSAAAPR